MQPKRTEDSSDDSDVLVIEERTTFLSTSEDVVTSRDPVTEETPGEDLHVPANIHVAVDADPDAVPALNYNPENEELVPDNHGLEEYLHHQDTDSNLSE